MIMLDEFQHAKTKNENNLEIDNEFSRVIWGLLDSGKFQSFEHPVDLQSLIRNKELLNEALENGVTVKAGIVISRKTSSLSVTAASLVASSISCPAPRVVLSMPKIIFSACDKGIWNGK